MKVRWSFVAGAVGALVIVLATWTVQDSLWSHELAVREQKLHQLQTDLEAREQKITQSQAQLVQQASEFKTRSDRAANQLEAVLKVQGSALERVKALRDFVHSWQSELAQTGE